MSVPATSENRMSEAYQGVSPNALLLSGAVPVSQPLWQRWAQRFGGSVALHLVVALFCVYALARLPEVIPALTTPETPNVTWLVSPGPGGGGGGGGNRMPDPPKKAEIVPAKVRPVEPPKVEPLKPELPQITVPAVTAVVELPGAMTAIPEPTLAQGSGSGGGGGTGKGTGVGPGTGSGIGEGYGGGTGGGAYQPGNGVTLPELIKEVKPSYTGDAMRAKVQGMVTMRAVVNPDGSVGSVEITRSLDSHFGLDEEAVRTVKLWRFRPGLRLGKPVPVQIEIEMSFTLR
jgi:periplasmic protein TonB